MKRLVILVLVIVGFIGGAIASAPFIAASDLAKRRIAAKKRFACVAAGGGEASIRPGGLSFTNSSHTGSFSQRH